MNNMISTGNKVIAYIHKKEILGFRYRLVKIKIEFSPSKVRKFSESYL